jgi:hypothetical protein
VSYSSGLFAGAMRRRRRRPRVKFIFKTNEAIELVLTARGEQEFNFAPYFTGENLSFSLSGNTANLSINESTGIANTSLVPEGSAIYNFYVTATSTLGSAQSPMFVLSTE